MQDHGSSPWLMIFQQVISYLLYCLKLRKRNPFLPAFRKSFVYLSSLRAGLGIVSVVFWISSSAQLTDNASTFRNINRKSYFRFHYDNDYFTKTDEYYSQGLTLEYVHPAFKYFPLSRLLLKARNSDPRYGISLNHIAYTPTSIRSDTILGSDRPFAACISFKTFLASSDSVGEQRISSAVSIGVIGPAAFGREIQTGIHRWLKNVLPKGWQYQVHNDVLVNYQVNYEKKLLSAGRTFIVNGTAEARVGTLDDKLGGGFNFMVGNFNDPYHNMPVNKKKLQYYLFGQGRLSLIGYDATMQGGVFNKRSPYTISSGNISRVTFQADAGIIVNFKKLFLSYTQSYLTKEFNTGHYHRWGGISAGYAF